MKKINVLQILAGAKEYNGVSEFLLSYYSCVDRERIHFDFLFCRENTMVSRQKELLLQGTRFFELKAKTSGSFQDFLVLIRKISSVMKEEEYDIIHVNTGSISITMCCVLSAILAKKRCIISHSHNTDRHRGENRRGIKRRIINTVDNIMRLIIRNYCVLLFACSDEAGEYLFGQKGVQSEKYHQIKNAIQTKQFLFDESVRESIRSIYGIEENVIVLGCVGRFVEQKNHQFLIDVFYEFHKRVPLSELWLIGDGNTMSEIKNKVRMLGIIDSVRFLGQRRDVNKLLQAMDAFVLTSLFEGLGTVSIEAQAACLPVFLSDEISHASNISKLVHFIPLSLGPIIWAERMEQELGCKGKRYDMYKTIYKNGYDIESAAKVLEKFYQDLQRKSCQNNTNRELIL